MALPDIRARREAEAEPGLPIVAESDVTSVTFSNRDADARGPFAPDRVRALPDLRAGVPDDDVFDLGLPWISTVPRVFLEPNEKPMFLNRRQSRCPRCRFSRFKFAVFFVLPAVRRFLPPGFLSRRLRCILRC